MAVCPSCANENPEGAKFCANCGTPLADDRGATPPVEERRVVSILFADLAGFTSRSDRADPEDVRRTLMPFHALAKEEIERFGGTLDKFIGDAAMGVFGAPVAHEDDPERAIRAAMAIQARAGELEIPVRAAVNTGEAVVTFATGPQIGENVAGDVVNTASRLQSIAPHGGVAVGEITYRATRDAVSYRELDPVEVKGKSGALRVWVVEHVREEMPGRPDAQATPFVGREAERGMLRELFDRATGDRSPRLVTIVGDPGIGKTRLVADLREHVQGVNGRVSWYRGRCLPYGESVTFAPLEEIVREATGVKRSDDRGEVAIKLTDRIAALAVSPDEAEWLRTRLAPLLGVADTADGANADREESFAAWTRFLAAEARLAPTVLVVEDLHWADPAMLDFLEQLEHVRDAPLLLVGTTRPELFDVRPAWAGGASLASILTLTPLSEEDMHELLADLLIRSVLPAEAHAPLLQNAGGNPLYALEFVRMLGDRDVVTEASTIALPETIQALIAARLDALTPAERPVLHDAAVVGDPFWSGAVASMAAGDANVDEPIAGLQHRGLIQPSPSPTMEDEDEYAFSHALIRDVAYGQIPRAGRAKRHMAVARWLEEKAGDRLDDRAELLAHHTTEALSLARVANLFDEVPALESNARRFLILAGDRQSSLDFGQAAAYYHRALELTPAGNPARAEVLRKATEVGWRSGGMDVESAIHAYEEVVELALAAGDRQQAAFGMRRLYFQLGFRGDGGAARAQLDRAVALLEGDEPTPVLAELYACLAEDEMFAGRSAGSLRWADRALELPHNDAIEIMALHIRGNGRCELGDLGGMDDLRESLRSAEASGVGLHLATSYSYLAEWVGLTEGPERGLELNDASVEVCDLRGIQGQGMWARAESMWLLHSAGRWDDLLDRALQIGTWAREHGDTIVESIGIAYRARVLAHRGIVDGTGDVLERGIPMAHQSGDLQIQTPVLVTAAIVEQLHGQGDAALDHIRAFEEVTRGGPTEYRELQAPAVMRICLANGDVELAAQVLGDRPVFVPATQHAVLAGRALLAEARHDVDTAAALFADAAAAWETYGDPFERAHALRGLSRCLVSLGRPDRAADASMEAEGLFATLGVPS